MAFIVVYDANVLVGNTQRDLLVRIAQSGLVQAKWTEQILDEMIAAVQKSRPDIAPEKLARVRALMIEAACAGSLPSVRPDRGPDRCRDRRSGRHGQGAAGSRPCGPRASSARRRTTGQRSGSGQEVTSA
jgi:hypothetical protein